MPGWADVLTDDQIWRVSSFLVRMDQMTPAVRQEWDEPAKIQPSAAENGFPQ
jgi:mono/diheme cytochrome c family protein